jgi:isopenicillin-N N-acyltransferase like protein
MLARMFEPTVIAGDARARGRAHGRALAPLVRGHLEAWKASLPHAGDPQGYVAALLRDTDFRPAIQAHAPDLLDEVAGVAEGAGLPADEIFALQLLDEEWAFRGRRGPDKCSSFAIAGRGEAWIGQNMDLGPYTDGFQALLRIEAHGGRPGALVFTAAGILGLMGVNTAGVGVCVNSLPQLASAPRGVPVAFVLRRLLQAASLAEAVRLVRAIPHATNQHYAIASPQGVRSFEACSGGVTEYRPADPSRVLHTNHPLSDAPSAPEPASARANSVARLRSLTERLSGGGAPGLAELQAALSSCDDPEHPVCRVAGRAGGLISFTTGSMISRVSPRGVESWVSPGPPSERGWTPAALPIEAAA